MIKEGVARHIWRKWTRLSKRNYRIYYRVYFSMCPLNFVILGNFYMCYDITRLVHTLLKITKWPLLVRCLTIDWRRLPSAETLLLLPWMIFSTFFRGKYFRYNHYVAFCCPTTPLNWTRTFHCIVYSLPLITELCLGENIYWHTLLW